MLKIVMLLLGFLWPYLVRFFFFILTTIGVGFLTYGTVTTAFQAATVRLENTITAMPLSMLMIAHAAGAGHVLACILAGLATRFAIAGIGDIKRLILRKAT